MSATIDQKAYLQKYLGGPSKDKKKKKKKAVKGKGFKIIDDDIDLTKLRPLDGDEIDLFDEGEDAPQIAGIVDERPEEVKKLEQFKTTTKWKVINQDDGFSSKLQIEEMKQDIKEAQKENEIIFGKMYSDSEDENKKDSDASPPRKPSKIAKDKNYSPQSKRDRNMSQSPVRKEQTDSDSSPPRKKTKTTDPKYNPNRKQNRNISPSPARKKQIDSDSSPPRKSKNTKSSNKHDSDSDFSPPRKRDRQSPAKRQAGDDSDLSPPRKNESRQKKQRKASRWGDFENEKRLANEKEKRDLHSSNKSNHKQSDSDISPPRKPRNQNDNHRDRRTHRNHKTQASDSDMSPPRRNKTSQYDAKESSSKYDNNRRRSVTPDNSSRHNPGQSSRRRSVSPKRNDERKNKHTDNERRHKINDNVRYGRIESNNRRQSMDTNERYQSNKGMSRSKRKSEESDTDTSPPRRRDDRRKYDGSRKYENHRKGNDTTPKMTKTLEGKMAGLQDAKQLREENEQFRRKENEVFNQMADEVSGRNATTVSRRSKRETSEERRKQKEKAERQKELDAKYQKWNRGLKQIEDQEARVQDYLHEAAKPLARFRNDKDLESSLKDIEREGDPMLKYIRERKRERGELAPEKPSYKGNFPPNRFNIRPGYRWDGVDRSNGYEKKFFEQQSKRKAQEEEAYKWSTEDL